MSLHALPQEGRETVRDEAQGSLADAAQHDMPPPSEQGPVSMAASRVVMHQIVLPSEVDALGICFGGQVCERQSSRRMHSAAMVLPCRGGSVNNWTASVRGRLGAPHLARAAILTRVSLVPCLPTCSSF